MFRDYIKLFGNEFNIYNHKLHFVIDVMLTALVVGVYDRLQCWRETIASIFSAEKRFSARPTCEALQQGDFARTRDSP